eukprot:490018_1
MEITKQIRQFTYDNWKYGAVFAMGTVTSLVASYSIAKSLSGYTHLQFITQIFLKHQQNKVSNLKQYDPIPNPIRPSNALVAWDALSRSQPKEPSKDPDATIKQLKDAMKVFVNAFQRIPSYIKAAEKHIINPKTNVCGYELVYPGASRENGVVLYVHGGAFIGGHVENGYPMLCVMMQYLGYSSFSVDYRASSAEHCIRDSVNDCIDAYKYIVNKWNIPAQKVIMIGESAGATLILLALQEINNNKTKYSLDMPLCGVLLSVLTDVELRTLPSIESNKDADCMSNVYALRECCKMGLDVDDADLKDPKYSPLYGKWTGLCPLYFSSGATEILLDDAREAVKKCKENHVDVGYEWHPSLPHGVGAWCAWIPESRDSVIRFIQWIKKLQ